MSGFITIGYFLLSLFFSLLTFVLWARFGLRFFRVSSLHPISQSINALTTPMLKPINGLFKSSNTRSTRYDWACFTALVVIELLKFVILSLLFLNQPVSLLFLSTSIVADLIIEPCNLLFYAIIIRVIMSWINPGWRNPLADIIFLITEPLLKWARRALPSVYGLDFSPFLIMIGLKTITLFISASIGSPFI